MSRNKTAVTWKSKQATYDNGAGPLPKTIRQDELEDLEQLRRLVAEYNHLRDSLVQRLEDGAKIEPGPLTASIERTVLRRLTWDRLKELVGQATVKKFRKSISPSVSRKIVIAESVDG